jgi:asparagine synthase (glutamine-hydrolysing)
MARSWIGCIGPDANSVFTALKTEQRIQGADFALAVCGDGGEPAVLTTDAAGTARAVLGNPAEAGCSAILTPEGTTVTLTCDPFGLYGVYTAQVGTSFWFGSDFQILRQAAGLPASLHLEALHGYLCFSYVPTPTTLCAGVKALPAGSSRTVAPHRTDPPLQEKEHVWIEATPFLSDESAAIEELRQRLRRVTARQLGGEREVGVFLSGGLDSSLVAALLVEAGARLHLYTLDFGAPYNVELPYTRAVAAHLKQPLHIVPARAEHIANALPTASAALQQAFGDAVTVPLYLLGKAAAQQVPTVFNGEFGDQLFGGWANKPMIAAALYGAPNDNRTAAYMATFHRFYGLTGSFYTSAMQETVKADAETWIQPELEEGTFTSLLHRLRAANIRLKGAQNIAPRARQLAEAVGLRIRSPFWDRNLAEWTFSCPPDWFLQGACEKYLLKRAAEPYLPSDIVWREKRGMGVPVTEWCLGGLKREIARILHPRRLKQDGLFRPEAVLALCRGSDHPGEIRTRRLGERLWTLLMFHVWKDVHAMRHISVQERGRTR